ncbi:hypothetical protein T484DRAFT_1787540 [Baffinella frigidus]|nr:hypothetical protein T484DRAFT_1787540 [Cryptophyta sp. CCMP2293]
MQQRGRVRALRAVDFRQSDQIGQCSPLTFSDAPARFDAVSCMFALHYFFETEESLMNLLTTVAHNLKTGGHFFGVCPDGLVENAIFKLSYYDSEWDTVTGAVDDSEGSREFMVLEGALQRLGAKVGLSFIHR